MHQKKPKISHRLHSIPINKSLCNYKHLVSYSIPLSCMVALLLLGTVLVNPNKTLKADAAEIKDEWVVTDPDSTNPTSDNGEANSENNTNNDTADESFGSFGGKDLELSPEDQDAGISLLSDVSPTLAITISDSTQTINTVQGGPTVYGSYNVGLTGSNIKDYALSIKASSANLTMPSGASSSTSTVSGAGGKTGNSMTANTWGYKLTETNTAESSYGTLAYASLPTTLTQITNGTVASPYNLNTSKKLVFAAKFGDNAAPGEYTGSITLSLSATPAQTGQLWSNGTPSYITDMQDIKSGFCKNNSSIAEGDTITLKDSRDTNSYTIYKAADGNCWMGQNLALTGPLTLASGDTDLATGTTWQLPASTTSNFVSDNTLVQIRTGSGLSGWKSGWGNYYSWCAATANTCQVNGTPVAANVDAASSICPKGWKLPTYSGDYSFSTLTGTKSGWTTSVNFNGVSGNSGYYFGSTKTTLPKNANFWPAAGFFSTSGFRNAGSLGLYWSRRAHSTTDAYDLSLSSSGVNPQYYNNRYGGYSVRCVATY